MTTPDLSPALRAHKGGHSEAWEGLWEQFFRESHAVSSALFLRGEQELLPLNPKPEERVHEKSRIWGEELWKGIVLSYGVLASYLKS